jgi:hypothetical protein
MRKLLLSILFLSASIAAFSQATPTGSKTRWVNGVYLGTKLDAAFGTVDSLVLYASGDSTLKFKYKGTARALAYATSLAGTTDYIPVFTSATTIGNGFLKQSSIGKVSIDGSTNLTEYSLQVGDGRTNNGYAYLDLVGDATYTDYGLRIERANTGANSTSTIRHRGTGRFALTTTEDAPIEIGDASAPAIAISQPSTGGNVTFRGVGSYATNKAASYTSRSFTDKNYVDSSRALDVQLAGTQTITGAKTFTNSTVQINTLTFGQGSGIDSQVIAKYPGSGVTIYRETASYPNIYGFNIPSAAGGNQNSFFDVFDEGSEKQVYYRGDGASGNNIWGIGSRATGDTGWRALTVVNQDGKMGIMTNSPSYELDVVGAGRFTNVRMSQDIIADNDLGYGWKGTDGTRFISYTSAGGTVLGSTGSVKSVIQGNGGYVLIGSTSNNASQALQVTGSLYNSALGTGTVYSNSGVLTNTNPSDSTLKDSIMPMRYGLAEVLKLKPKTFYYKSDSAHTVKYGFIAQDVKPIMPDVVRKIDPKDKNSKLGLETDGIYVTLVKAIQEQQAIIDDLKKRIIALENK